MKRFLCLVLLVLSAIAAKATTLEVTIEVVGVELIPEIELLWEKAPST